MATNATVDKLIASVKEAVNASNANLAGTLSELGVAISSMTARLDALERIISQTNEKRPVRTAAPKAAKPEADAPPEAKTKYPANSLLFFKDLIANNQEQREKYSTDEYAALVEGSGKWPKNFDHSKKDAAYWKSYANILWGLLDKTKKDEIKAMFEACKSQQPGTEELPLELDE